MSESLQTSVSHSHVVDAALIERVVVHGDLSALSPEQKTEYYLKVCESVGVNPVTGPFAYMKLQGKEVLYAKRDCTDQLRRIHGISATFPSKETIDGICIITCRVVDKTGRSDESTGAVSVKGLSGDVLANAMMKAETKAKRRATLSICGLGMLDETEIETIPAAHVTNVTSIQAPQKPTPILFNARDKADIDWLKAHPEMDLMDELTIKKVAQAFDKREKTSSELKLAINRVEAQIKASQDASLVQ